LLTHVSSPFVGLLLQTVMHMQRHDMNALPFGSPYRSVQQGG
jgi:hypothetical protein